MTMNKSHNGLTSVTIAAEKTTRRTFWYAMPVTTKYAITSVTVSRNYLGKSNHGFVSFAYRRIKSSEGNKIRKNPKKK